MSVRVLHGDMRDHLVRLAADGLQVHACVTDPPYHLTSIVKRFGSATAAAAQHGTDGAFARASRGFMGKEWDGGDIAFQASTWRLVYDVMLPGAHLIAFGGTRGWHRMVCAIEDAGFEIRDSLMWAYGSGMPKSHNVAKGIDKTLGTAGKRIATGAEVRRMIPGADQYAEGWIKDNGRTYQPHDYVPGSPEAEAWSGWGTALKPSLEPIVLARKPMGQTVARNVLQHGCGGLNISACRIPLEGGFARQAEASSERRYADRGSTDLAMMPGPRGGDPSGRWPGNLLLDGSKEVEAAFAAFGEKPSGKPGVKRGIRRGPVYGAERRRPDTQMTGFGDTGSASRFFFSAKAGKDDRVGSDHPTVKPTDLMRWLVQLVTPPGGTVLDCFAGTGSTGLAADQVGVDAVLIERDAQYIEDIKRKISSNAGLFAEIVS